MGSYFNKEKGEDMIHRRAIIGTELKKGLKHFTFSFILLSTFVASFFSFGLILMIDGGISILYLVTKLSISVYEKLIEKYLKNIPEKKKRDFYNQISKFYINALNGIVNDNDNNQLKSFIQDFINDENILEMTLTKFKEKKSKFIDESSLLKNKFNILVIGPTGAGKSTLINEFLQINNAEECFGDVGTLNFKEYTTSDSKYTLIDSRGLDLSSNIETFYEILKDKIIKCNMQPYTFIDMIYYCTNSQNRLQIEEINLLKKLEKLFDFERMPLIIVNTLCLSDSFHSQFNNFIKDKYGDKYTCIKVLSRDVDNNKANGMENLKRETEMKVNDINQSSYYGKFIANISQVLYKEYTDNIFKTLIKGFKRTSKEDSIENIFQKIFNMYRFQGNNGGFNENQRKKMNEMKQTLLTNYNEHLDNFIKIVIKYNAESIFYSEYKNKQIYNDEKIRIIEEIYNNNIKKEFMTFKNDIDELIFPCFLEIFKIKIMSYFNERIMNHLKPQIDKLMAVNK